MMKGDFCLVLSTAPLTMNPCSPFLVGLCILLSCILTHVWFLHALSRVSLSLRISGIHTQWQGQVETWEVSEKMKSYWYQRPDETHPLSLASDMSLAKSCGFLKWPELPKILSGYFRCSYYSSYRQSPSSTLKGSQTNKAGSKHMNKYYQKGAECLFSCSGVL